MFDIIPPLLIILGITGLIYIFQYRQKQKETTPIEELEAEKNLEKSDSERRKSLEKFYRIFKRQNYQKINEEISSFAEKTLVRSRIIILRIDRAIFQNLTKIRIKRNASEFNGKDQNGIINVFSEEKFLQNSKETDETLDSVQEEKRLLKKIKADPQDLKSFKNLARIYLWRKDFSSACWALLQAYRLDKEDNVVQDLLVELYEKRGGAR